MTKDTPSKIQAEFTLDATNVESVSKNAKEMFGHSEWLLLKIQ